jgi:hypothetical protein
MAHGSPIYYICTSCIRYILVGRFSTPPKCDKCSKALEQTNKEKMRNTYNLSLFHDFSYSFNTFTKLTLP